MRSWMRIGLGISCLALLSVPATADSLIAQASPPATPPAAAANAPLPSFLPDYYASAFVIADKKLHFEGQEEKDQILRYRYASEGIGPSLIVEGFKCDATRCRTVYENALRFFNGQATSHSGRFRSVNETEFRVEWWAGLSDSSTFVYKLPSGLVFWTLSTPFGSKVDRDAYFSQLKRLADRQRYEEARLAGNVEMGSWDPQIRDYAEQLLGDGKREAAIGVLRELLATAPADYEAQLVFAEHSGDPASVRTSAGVVYANAESDALLSRAAKLLGVTPPTIASVPVLKREERGLQLILIPLPPCNVALLSEAAKVYEQITNVPTKLARLEEDWAFGSPDRIPDQKRVRQTIIEKLGPNVDFTGWTEERYFTELGKTVEGKDALAKYWMADYIDRLGKRQGQYLAGTYLDHLANLVRRYRSEDERTMYVGVTEANIYSGDLNFLFSVFDERPGWTVSLLSYAVMEAKPAGDSYESRKRLAERIAKELVPASLKSLRIPRPADPTDPYSYSSGVDRLNQKTLTLSPPVREALERFR